MAGPVDRGQEAGRGLMAGPVDRGQEAGRGLMAGPVDRGQETGSGLEDGSELGAGVQRGLEAAVRRGLMAEVDMEQEAEEWLEHDTVIPGQDTSPLLGMRRVAGERVMGTKV